MRRGRVGRKDVEWEGGLPSYVRVGGGWGMYKESVDEREKENNNDDEGEMDNCKGEDGLDSSD